MLIVGRFIIILNFMELIGGISLNSNIDERILGRRLLYLLNQLIHHFGQFSIIYIFKFSDLNARIVKFNTATLRLIGILHPHGEKFIVRPRKTNDICIIRMDVRTFIRKLFRKQINQFALVKMPLIWIIEVRNIAHA